MDRPVRGAEVLEMAQEMILRARTIEELRLAQAVVLQLAQGLSLEQIETGKAIGRSKEWTCRLCNRFLASETIGDGQRQRPGGRRRQNLTIERECEVLAPFPRSRSNWRLRWGASSPCPCCTSTHPLYRIILMLDGAGRHASAVLKCLAACACDDWTGAGID